MPNSFKLKGERPPKKASPCEYKTSYRKNMSEFIELNTGIRIHADSMVVARFYDLIADYLGL